jgi:hypothetical protein
MVNLEEREEMATKRMLSYVDEEEDENHIKQQIIQLIKNSEYI